VVEVNRPDRSSTADRVQMLRKPWLALGRAGGMGRGWCGMARDGRRARKQHPVDAIVVGYLGHFDVIAARLAFPRSTIVLDHLIFAADTAHDRAVGGRLTRIALVILDRLAIACASFVVVDTTEHLAMLPGRARSRALVLPVGAPDAWFDAGAARERPAGAGRAALKVVFHGLFTPLQGAPVIGAALADLSRRGVHLDVTLIGSGQDADATLAALGDTPVEWRDWVQPDRLPALLAGADVCLGIFGTSGKAHRVVPNKVYQGLAAQCAVVTSDTAPQRSALGDAVAYVPAGDATALADALAALSSDRVAVAALAGPGAALARERFSPEAIGLTLATALKALR